ncbi:transposase [Acidithrix sp. C25]|uniref:transposase n=1 Tax=Acidithrix sp. C25 TaxID=1671482 RepID=UPI00191BBA28
MIDIVESRSFTEVAKWVKKRPTHFRERIAYGTLDMSNSYAAVFSVTLPKATQVVDRFHVIKLATTALDGVRRRLQLERTGHRGRKDDPLYRSRKLLVMKGKNLDEKTTKRIETLLELGDPNAEVALAYRVKEALSDFYECRDIHQAQKYLEEIVDRISLVAMPLELRRLGKTLKYWFKNILIKFRKFRLHRDQIGANP